MRNGGHIVCMGKSGQYWSGVHSGRADVMYNAYTGQRECGTSSYLDAQAGR